MGDFPPLTPRARLTRRRWAVALAGAVALGAALTAGAARWTLRDGRALEAVTRQVEAATGLVITAGGTASLRILPRPTIEVQDVTFRAHDQSVQADAERLKGTLDLAALTAGEMRLTRVSLDRPTVTLDVDRLRALVGPMLQGQPGQILRLLRTGGLSLHDGVIRLRSAQSVADALLTDVSATLAWPAEGAGASLGGSATWRGVAVSVALDLAEPDELARGGTSLGSLHLKSDPLDLQVIATLSGSGDALAAGRIDAATPRLTAFLRLIDHPAPQLGGIERARLDGALSVGGGALSISDATLGLEDMQFEGALAVRRKGDRPALAATLATDRVDLNRFLGELPAATGPDGRWAVSQLDTRAIADDDIDLRVSAAQAVLGPFRLDDSSLSLQSGDGRLELSLGEARAYDGLLKARIVARVDGDGTAARLDAALSRLDLRKLLRDAGASYGSGILTGHVGVEVRGASPAAMAASATGRGEVTLRDGRIDDAAKRTLAGRGDLGSSEVPADLEATFDDAAARFGIERGQVALGESWVTWPSARAAVAGTASLPDQRLDLRLTLGPKGEDASAAYALAGPWRDLQLARARPPS